jgi:putative heme-binding domain-containing protein
LLYSVPKGTQGSWINLCVDPKGRLLVSDQMGPLYRIQPPPPGGGRARVERLDLPLGGAHGLLYARGSLYAVVNEPVMVAGARPRPGLYRARSKDGGDTFAPPVCLRGLPGSGEHGPHAVLPGPDGNSLFVVCGNETQLVAPLGPSPVPRLWGEDGLSPALARYSGVLPPAGCIYRVDPAGKDWRLWSVGLRNPFDAACNRHGDLFTFDADMEADMNTPWYRPTRLCLVTSGSEFGFRDGSHNSPPRFLDTLPAIHDIGPGSPTGMTFGYAARFPARYREALFVCDWARGCLTALHLTPDGAAYRALAEDFLSGAPLPLTDVVVNPTDGALYFITGGRGTQSGLYRVTYAGQEPTDPIQGGSAPGPLHALRRRLEAWHGREDPRAVDAAWPYLGHPDRFVRFAARVAIEHQDPGHWQQRALHEPDPAAAVNALLALVRVVGQDPVTHPRKLSDPVPGAEKRAPILAALERIDCQGLSDALLGDLVRVHTVLFNRLGGPDRADRDRLLRRFEPLFPARTFELNADLCQLLVYLESPHVAERALRLLAAAPSQEEQIEYAKSLRLLKTGWTPARRQAYFAWFRKAAHFPGYAPLRRTLGQMKQDAVATLSARERRALQPLLEAKLPREAVARPRAFVKHWKLAELVSLVENGLTGRDPGRGRRLFGEAQCFACHRFGNEGGGLAPDLTGIARRYGVRDLLEKVLDPGKAVSDQYAASVITTTDGKVVTGRIVNYQQDEVQVVTDLLNPSAVVTVHTRDVEAVVRSKVSMMPAGLFDTLRGEEIRDLLAYLMSEGDRNQKAFRKGSRPGDP